MNREEFEEFLNTLPKVDKCSAFYTVNVDDIRSAIDRLNAVPTYKDLLRENKVLKNKYESEKLKNQNALEYVNSIDDIILRFGIGDYPRSLGFSSSVIRKVIEENEKYSDGQFILLDRIKIIKILKGEK